MKLAGLMVGGSALGALLASVAADFEATTEIWLGMAAPLALASTEWFVAERTHRRSPEAVTRVLLRFFVARMILFAGYVIAVLSIASIRPVPFVASFVGFFLALFIVGAFALRRLMASAASRPDFRSRGLAG
jgi:hypothetical protein